MNIAILYTYSESSADMAFSVLPRLRGYAICHDYSLVFLSRPWDYSLLQELERTRTLLKFGYDMVLTLDPDVIITSLHPRIDGFVGSNDSVVLSSEPVGRSPVNTGAIIWRNCRESFTMIDDLLDLRPFCLGRGPQELMAERPDLLARLTILPPDKLCSSDQWEGRPWQPGDFLFHALGGDVPSKIERISGVLARL